MTLQDEYTTTTTTLARKAQDAFSTAADSWSQSFQKMTDQAGIVPIAPALPTEVPTAFVAQWLDFNERIAKVNRDYVLNLTSAFNAVSGAVRQHVDGLNEAMRDQSQTVAETAKNQLDTVVRAENEAVEHAEQIERDRVRAARNAERARVRETRKVARERYEGLTKAELSDVLASRDLPKTGNVDELVERLVDADTK